MTDHPTTDTAELDGLTDEDAAALLADPDDTGDEGVTDPDTTAEDDADDPRLSKARKDAATYRERLRTAEADRDRLAEELAEHRRDQITRLAAEAGMAAPEDLLAVTDQDALYDPETGRVDPERVRAAAADVLAARPHWKARRPLPGRPVERLHGGPNPGEPPRTATWADVIATR